MGGVNKAITITSTQTTFTTYHKATNDHDLIIYQTDVDSRTGTFFIDNVSARELNGYPGIVSADATYNRENPNKQAMSDVMTLDGDSDYLDIGDVLDLGTGDFTISAWVKVADFDNQYIASKRQSANDRWKFQGTQTNPPRLQFHQTVGSTAHVTFLGTSISLDDHKNAWTHLVVSADRDGKVVGYVNGTADDADINGEATDLDNTGSLRIGVQDTTYLNGQIDEVAIWDAALDADAVAAMYAAGRSYD